mmetsp:Transcript_5662/g.8718  ORF Transcript_5662/g.8718 Transcript_5662/m.8718 type:complete len:88 (-) Transcript_5662:257-520(-)|eukprot:scaffold16495_cov76-Skeletonema_dohrnii-CCMP3373.AAC.1
MPISEKAQRAWKAGTAVVTAWTAWYGLFHIDYGPHEHVFSELQRWYRRKIDDMLGINLNAARQIESSKHQSASGAVGSQSQSEDEKR